VFLTVHPTSFHSTYISHFRPSTSQFYHDLTLTLGRRFIGVDIDQEAAETTRGRIVELLSGSSQSDLI
jgi:3-methyladenine DNA glycosylase Mpg